MSQVQAFYNRLAPAKEFEEKLAAMLRDDDERPHSSDLTWRYAGRTYLVEAKKSVCIERRSYEENLAEDSDGLPVVLVISEDGEYGEPLFALLREVRIIGHIPKRPPDPQGRYTGDEAYILDKNDFKTYAAFKTYLREAWRA